MTWQRIAPGATFDLGFTRFGVMFFADSVAAFRNIRSAMKPTGRLLLGVFRTGAENSWTTAAVAAIRHLVPPSPALGPEDAKAARAAWTVSSG
jgi:SAM-dependent methyltransferase